MVQQKKLKVLKRSLRKLENLQLSLEKRWWKSSESFKDSQHLVSSIATLKPKQDLNKFSGLIKFATTEDLKVLQKKSL